MKNSHENKKEKKKELALRVKNITKTFIIPHERIDTMRGYFVNIFKKKTYDNFDALNDVSFDVYKGEFLSIIGKNGSGKSTLLKVLAGIYNAESGSVETHGRISPFLELGIGFNPELSGRDNVYLNATVLGLTRKQIESKFDDIVQFSELERFIDQKLKNYSSGMQVRLAFSVAIHANREILLMDEVLAVGDINFQRKCLNIFRKMKQEGKTIVFVSHDVGTVQEFSDRVVVLNEGKVVKVGGPKRAVYEYSQIMMKEAEKTERTAIEMEENEKKKKEAVQQRGAYRFAKVTPVNEKGEESLVFERGETIGIKVDIDLDRVEKDLYLGIAILDRDKEAWITGNNTYWDKVNHPWVKGRNTVTLQFPDNFFHRGEFFILSNLFIGHPQDSAIIDTYDSREKNQFFKSLPKDKRQGLVYMEHEWIHSTHQSS